METPKGVSFLKFVGIISLGLLTGLSYTISTLAVPTLLDLPSAATASRTLSSLAASSQAHLRALTALASTAFLTAYVLSPRHARHPYLLYTGVISVASAFAHSIAPALPDNVLLLLRPTSHHGSAGSAGAARKPAAVTAPVGSASSFHSSTRRGMEQSYEVLGDVHSDDAATSGGEEDVTPAASTVLPNGEGVREEFDTYQRGTVVRTAMAGLGFLMAIVGIWGDGVAQVLQTTETIVFEL